MPDSDIFLGAAAMGAIAGMRSLSAPAIAGRLLRSGPSAVVKHQLHLLKRPSIGRTLTGLAMAELVADKLPFIPRRTTAASLTVRALSGALSGAAVNSAKRRSWIVGAAIGAAAAIGASYAAYELRKRSVQKLRLPDPVVAIVEDAVVAAGGVLLLSKLRSTKEFV